MTAPSPFFFGPAEARLFGWLHLPPATASGAIGLVICNPFGFEEVCAHRSLAHLAREAATAGVPTLRFDYAGCGNSSGDEFDADTWARWLASVHQAVDTLKVQSGVQRVCLLGLRLGATLAAVAAAERSDIEVLVAIAPVVQGRLYVRELRALAAASAMPDAAPTQPENLLEAAGFFMTEETTQALAAVDLTKLPNPPAPHLLIVQRDDMPPSTKWEQALAGMPVSVRSETWPGYAGMVEDPQRAVIPEFMLASIVNALKQWSVTLPASSCAPQVSTEGTLEFGACREVPVHIATEGGTDGSALFGVLTTCVSPVASGPSTVKRGILMINSGAVHHIGPNRLWVRLARRWAARGDTVLRLDLSGIGDSLPRPSARANVVYSAEATMDINAALHYMQNQLGVSECHLVGLCSGAYHAFKAGVAGMPLKSAVMINPLTFFWTAGVSPDDGIKDYELLVKSENYRKQMFSLEPWRKLLTGNLDLRYIVRFAVRRLSVMYQLSVQKLQRWLGGPVKDDLGHELAQAAAHGVQQKFVFAIGDPGLEMLSSGGGRSLDRLQADRRLSIDRLPQADHTFTRLEARERLITAVDRLMFASD